MHYKELLKIGIIEYLNFLKNCEKFESENVFELIYFIKKHRIEYGFCRFFKNNYIDEYHHELIAKCLSVFVRYVLIKFNNIYVYNPIRDCKNYDALKICIKNRITIFENLLKKIK